MPEPGYLKVRIFVSSPNNLTQERDCLAAVVAELNRDWGDELRITLEVLDWRTHIAAVAGRTPQAVINEQLPVETWDIFVGIMWYRFGTPTGDINPETDEQFQGGTEEEFTLAYNSWRASQKPHILFYQCKRPVPPDQIDVRQLNKVRGFLEKFSSGGEHHGFIESYHDIDALQTLLRKDITILLRRDFGRQASEGFALSLGRGSRLLIGAPDLAAGETGIAAPTSAGPKDEFPSLEQDVRQRAVERLRQPEPPKRLLGRKQLLAEMRDFLLAGKVPIVIYGIPGIGKSAFLATLTSDPAIRAHYGSHIYWVNLRASGVSSVQGIVDEIAKGLGYTGVLKETQPLAKAQALSVALAQEAVEHIFIFDNAYRHEHEEAILQFVREVTPNIVVGSRSILALPDAQQRRLTELDPEDAMELFRSQARLQADDSEQIVRICALLGYHPQAIILAAPQIWRNGLSLDELAKFLESKRLEALNQGAEAEELNMRASFAVSYDTLPSDDERLVFDICGAFALSGANLRPIAAVMGCEPFEARKYLGELQARSLLERDEGDSDHYHMHPLLHEYAHEKLLQRESALQQEGQSPANLPTGRLIDYYLRYARQNQTNFPQLEAEHDNLLQASAWAWRREDWPAVYQTWEALDTWLDDTGDWSPMALLNERAVEAARRWPDHAIELAKALASRSTYYDLTGQLKLSLADAEESLKIARQSGDDKSIVYGLMRLASTYMDHLEQVQDALDRLKEAWQYCETIPDWIESAYVAYLLGACWLQLGDTRQAQDWLERCLQIARSLQPTAHLEALRYEGFASTTLGNLFMQQGDYTHAREQFERSRKIKETIGNRHSIAIVISSLANLESRLDNKAKAIELYRQAADIDRQIGATISAIGYLATIGDLNYAEDNQDEALRSYEEARTLLRAILDAPPQALAGMQRAEGTRAVGVIELDDVPTEARASLQRLGQMYIARGRYADAIGVFTDYLNLPEGVLQRDEYDLGVAEFQLGTAYSKANQPEQAIAHLERAAVLLKDHTSSLDQLTVLRTLLSAYEGVDQDDKIAEVRSSIDALLQPIIAAAIRAGDVETLFETTEYLIEQAQLDRARETLGHAAAIQTSSNENDRMPRSMLSEDMGALYQQLGRAYARQDRYEEALTAYRDAETWVKALAEDEPAKYGVILHDIADVYRAQGSQSQARDYYEQAATFKARGDDRTELGLTVERLVRTEIQLGHKQAALRVCEHYVPLLQVQPHPAEDAVLGRILALKAQVYLDERQPKAALAELTRAQELFSPGRGATLEDMLTVLALRVRANQALSPRPPRARRRRRLRARRMRARLLILISAFIVAVVVIGLVVVGLLVR